MFFFLMKRLLINDKINEKYKMKKQDRVELVIRFIYFQDLIILFVIIIYLEIQWIF